MAKAKFRLEALLKLRQMDEDKAKRVVADRLRMIQKVRRQIGGLQGQLAEATSEMRSLVLTGPIVPVEAARQRGFLGRLRYQLLQTQADLRAERARLASERAELSEASKQCKTLEKLKERQNLQWLKRQQRREQQETDELGVVRFAHARVDDGPEQAGW